MRVVIFATATPSVGGIGQYIQQLLPELVPVLTARGCEITLILSKDSVWSNPQKAVREIRLPVARHERVSRVVLEHAYALLLGLGADVFVSLESRLPMVPIPARRRLVVVHDLYPLLERDQPSLYPREHTPLKLFYWCLVVERGVKQADRIVTVSNSGVEELRTVLKVPEDRIARIYPGIDHQRFHLPESGDSVANIRQRYSLPDAFYLYVSGFGAHKNFRCIAESYARSRLDPTTMLPVVVTAGKENHPAISLIEQSGCSSLFRFIGYVPDRELPLLYAASRALLYPSLREGFGFPPLEAMACGTTAVVSNRPAVPEVVGDAALIFDPDDPASLARALQKVNDESLRRVLIEKGLQRAKLFDWRRTAECMGEEIVALAQN